MISTKYKTMKKIIAIIIILVTANIGFVSAQDSYTSVQYVVSFGTGDLGDYVDKTSFRGFLFEYRGGIVNEHLNAGLDLGWNAFYEEKPYDTYTQGTASISTKQWRYTNQYPILASADYLIRPGEALNPYVNFGIGTMYTKRKTLVGSYIIYEDAWHFAIKPEIGLMYNVRGNTGIKLAAKYYTAFASGELETQSYFSISAGLVFLF